MGRHQRLRLVRLHVMLGRTGPLRTWRGCPTRWRPVPKRPCVHRRTHILGWCGTVVDDGELGWRAFACVPGADVHIVFPGHYWAWGHPRALLFQSLVLYGELGFGRLAGDARPCRLLRLPERLLS